MKLGQLTALFGGGLAFLRGIKSQEAEEKLEKSLGYAVGKEGGLHMKEDWAVSYHKSEFEDKPCVYFTWSAIEYIFV